MSNLLNKVQFGYYSAGLVIQFSRFFPFFFTGQVFFVTLFYTGAVMRVITVNVNGIRAAQRKGFFEWLSTQHADVVCIQETKAHESQLDERLFYPDGYHCNNSDNHRDKTDAQGAETHALSFLGYKPRQHAECLAIQKNLCVELL